MIWAHSLPQLLLHCIHLNETEARRSQLEVLRDADWDSLAVLAKEQGISAIFYHRLKSKNLTGMVPESVLKELHDHALFNAARNLRLLSEFKAVIAALNARSIPVIVLKGVCLVQTVYGDLSLREIGDIDLLVRSEDLFLAGDVLKERGYRPDRRYDGIFNLAAVKHLPTFRKANAFPVEIHWTIISTGGPWADSVADLWQRAVPANPAGNNVRALSPEDLLLHLCLHTSYQHQFTFRLRPFCDITEIIRHYAASLNWEALLHQTSKWRCQRGVFLSLHLARELLGASVPDRVLHSLRPRSFDLLLVDAVLEQLFTPDASGFRIGPTLAKALHQSSGPSRFRAMIGRVLLPKEQIADRYSVPPGSWRVYLYYPIRAIGLLFRHSGLIWRISRGHRKTAQTIRRVGSIAEWLDGGR